jgi:hypothetical protein
VANASAPPGFAYSADGVKKRRLETEAAGLADRRKEVLGRGVQRSRALADPARGGLLRRELGLLGPLATEDEALSCFTRGLREKGEVAFGGGGGRNGASTSTSNLPLFCVTNHEAEKGLGYVFACKHATLAP